MRKVLVIEDDAVVRCLALKTLDKEGFECQSASNGTQGIKLAQGYKPDLIICDIMMPEIDGYGVLKALQQEPQTALIPFIFLTAKEEKDSIRRGIELGADDYLTKPFDEEQLLRAISIRFQKQTMQQQRVQLLLDELGQFRQLVDAKDEMLDNFNQEVRRPISNVLLAIEMLAKDDSVEQRTRYLQILRDEFSRELTLLNRVDELQKLLTPENVDLLSQFNMLNLKA